MFKYSTTRLEFEPKVMKDACSKMNSFGVRTSNIALTAALNGTDAVQVTFSTAKALEAYTVDIYATSWDFPKEYYQTIKVEIATDGLFGFLSPNPVITASQYFGNSSFALSSVKNGDSYVVKKDGKEPCFSPYGDIQFEKEKFSVTKPYTVGSQFFELYLKGDKGVYSTQPTPLEIRVGAIKPAASIKLNLALNYACLTGGGKLYFGFDRSVMFVQTKAPYPEIKALFQISTDYAAITEVSETQIVAEVYKGIPDLTFTVKVAASNLVLGTQMVENVPQSLAAQTFTITVVDGVLYSMNSTSTACQEKLIDNFLSVNHFP